MKIFINSRSGLNIVELDNVIYLKADGNYTEFYYADGKTKIELSCLSDFEVMIEKAFSDTGERSPFFRVNRSLMINCNTVKSVQFPTCLLTFQSEHVHSLKCSKETLRVIRDHLVERYNIQ